MCNVNFYYCPELFEQNKNIKWYVDYDHFDQIIKEARDYGNILVNKKHKTMKDNLLPFDLEEAKKDPSRIRNAYDSDLAGIKPKEVLFFNNAGGLAICWEISDKLSRYSAYTPFSVKEELRLTPKRRFVKEYENIFGMTYYVSTEHRPQPDGHSSAATYELIPVKEDETV